MLFRSEKNACRHGDSVRRVGPESQCSISTCRVPTRRVVRGDQSVFGLFTHGTYVSSMSDGRTAWECRPCRKHGRPGARARRRGGRKRRWNRRACTRRSTCRVAVPFELRAMVGPGRGIRRPGGGLVSMDGEPSLKITLWFGSRVESTTAWRQGRPHNDGFGWEGIWDLDPRD